MIEQTLFLGDWCSWLVKVFYAVGDYGSAKVIRTLEDFGCNGETLEKARKNLGSGDLNVGLTYSNLDRKLSVMVIGQSSSAEQFADTLTHEIGHLASHISQSLKLSPYGEEVQYLNGEIMRQMFPVAKKFLCEHCREVIGLD